MKQIYNNNILTTCLHSILQTLKMQVDLLQKYPQITEDYLAENTTPFDNKTYQMLKSQCNPYMRIRVKVRKNAATNINLLQLPF